MSVGLPATSSLTSFRSSSWPISAMHPEAYFLASTGLFFVFGHSGVLLFAGGVATAAGGRPQ